MLIDTLTPSTGQLFASACVVISSQIEGTKLCIAPCCHTFDCLPCLPDIPEMKYSANIPDYSGSEYGWSDVTLNPTLDPPEVAMFWMGSPGLPFSVRPSMGFSLGCRVHGVLLGKDDL
jgi:hypothetical protein